MFFDNKVGEQGYEINVFVPECQNYYNMHSNPFFSQFYDIMLTLASSTTEIWHYDFFCLSTRQLK